MNLPQANVDRRIAVARAEAVLLPHKLLKCVAPIDTIGSQAKGIEHSSDKRLLPVLRVKRRRDVVKRPAARRLRDQCSVGLEIFRALAALRAVPLECEAQALLKSEAWLMAEVANRGGDVGLRIAHIAGTRRSVE